MAHLAGLYAASAALPFMEAWPPLSALLGLALLVTGGPWKTLTTGMPTGSGCMWPDLQVHRSHDQSAQQRLQLALTSCCIAASLAATQAAVTQLTHPLQLAHAVVHKTACRLWNACYRASETAACAALAWTATAGAAVAVGPSPAGLRLAE